MERMLLTKNTLMNVIISCHLPGIVDGHTSIRADDRVRRGRKSCAIPSHLTRAIDVLRYWTPKRLDVRSIWTGE